MVDQVFTDPSSGNVVIVPAQAPAGAASGSCTITNQYTMNPTVAGHDQRVSIVMAALINGKQINVQTDGCAPDGRPNVVSVAVNRQNRPPTSQTGQSAPSIHDDIPIN
jgi:hypothetical protein